MTGMQRRQRRRLRPSLQQQHVCPCDRNSSLVAFTRRCGSGGRQPESKEEEQKEKKKKKKKKKKTLTKTAEGCEVDSGQETCRQMLAEIDRGRANGEEITETLLLLQKSLQRWCARHPEMLDEPFLDQLEVMGKVHALVESKVLRRSERLQTAPPDGSV